ncbi:ABC transporter ATP-binding protein [Pediococcus pentosaceus]|nr:ABC transporter ATP-binding protein [Pediococcus pentosaceus]KAF0434668.1 ABC transporter ATP-binding protein [Pediococcus pentosaceus]KAF0443108.1 ABC transporter ATP-binding protein [Pediococcus pentosaceus]
MVNTILKEADLFCPNSVRINFTIYHIPILFFYKIRLIKWIIPIIYA